MLINGKVKRDEGREKKCRKVDTAFIGGRAFALDYAGAKEQAKALVKLAVKRTAYEDVPTALLKFKK